MKEKQHLRITLAVLKYYSLPPQYAAYIIWPDYVPKLEVRQFRYRDITFPVAVRVPHHSISRESFVEEFLMNVSDGRRGSPEDRKGALANTVKLLHYVQDGCTLHRCEEDLIRVPLELRWVAEGEALCVRLPEGAKERAEALAGEVYPRPKDREAVRAAVALSSATLKAFLQCVGWQKQQDSKGKSQ
jgi:hypothetical protein